MEKSCVICGGDEAGGDILLEAPCQRHWVCTDDIGSFFERATENESLYPPKDFFNSEDHLTAPFQAAHSAAVASALKTMLRH